MRMNDFGYVYVFDSITWFMINLNSAFLVKFWMVDLFVWFVLLMVIFVV